MQIDFFEEFVDERTLPLIQDLPKPTRIIIAAGTPAQYRLHARTIQEKTEGVSTAFWPILPGSYWISPFSDHADIVRLTGELAEMDPGEEVMYDLELPIMNKKLFLRNAPGFFRKKDAIRKSMKTLARRGIRVSSAEYPPPGRAAALLLRGLGVSFDPPGIPYTRIVMYYTSMIPDGWIRRAVDRQVLRDARRYGDLYQAGVGTIAPGILGDEPVLSPAGLEKDLAFLRDAGVQRAVVFRLGGMNDDYLMIVRAFSALS